MKTAEVAIGKRTTASRLEHFFHAREVPYSLAIVRIVLPLVLLLDIVRRWPVARELFSADGAPAQLSITYGYGAMLPEFPGVVTVALFSLLGFFLVTISLGWYTRVSLFAAAVLYFYFPMMDAVSTVTKYTVIATHGLVLLGFSGCGSVWSIDAWRARSRRAEEGLPENKTLHRSAVWPRRLIQILMGTIYFGAAITKMHTPAYFSGDQLMFWQITQFNASNPLGNYLTMYPAVLVIAAYVTIIWEVMFLFLAWKGWGRAIMLTMGVSFHLGTALLLGLTVFPLVCCGMYFAFFGEADVRRALLGLRRLARRLGLSRRSPRVRHAVAPSRSRRLPAPAVFAFAVVAVALGSTELEYWMDPYGLRGENGPHRLREISQERIGELFTPSSRIRDEDLVFSFETGTTMFGGHLTGRRDEFRHGETMLAQVKFNPPHADMWIECNLHDADGHVIDEIGRVIPREMLRGNWYYRITPSLKPGDYSLVLKNAGREIDRRSFEILPAAGTAQTARLNAN